MNQFLCPYASLDIEFQICYRCQRIEWLTTSNLSETWHKRCWFECWTFPNTNSIQCKQFLVDCQMAIVLDQAQTNSSFGRQSKLDVDKTLVMVSMIFTIWNRHLAVGCCQNYLTDESLIIRATANHRIVIRRQRNLCVTLHDLASQ